MYMTTAIKDTLELYNKKAAEYYACNYADTEPDLTVNLSYDKVDDNEIVQDVLQIMGINCFKKYLYQHQLSQITKYAENDKPANKMSLSDFSVKANTLLGTYQWKAGGYNLEDREWSMYDCKTGTNYDVDNNELMFVNTVPLKIGVDRELDRYTDLLVQHLNKFSANISVECRLRKERKDGVVFVMLLCQDNDMVKHAVGL